MGGEIEKIRDLVNLLERALSEPVGRVDAIRRFQKAIFEGSVPVNDVSAEEWQILHDLAYDLDYYEPDVRYRAEDPAFYGDERLEVELRQALEKLSDLTQSDPPSSK